MRTIILGVGNPVRTDDAAGLFVARALRERLVDSPDIDVKELWAGGFRLVEAMVGYDRAVVIDAMRTGTEAPGTVRRLALDALAKTRNVTCVHDASLSLALAMWSMSRLPVPEDIAVWGIEAADLETLGEELSASVRAAVPVAADAILDDLRAPPRSTP